MPQLSQNDRHDLVEAIIRRRRRTIQLLRLFCVRCGLCADSCFLYRNHHGAREYMPSYKALTSMTVLSKRAGAVSREQLEIVQDLIWKKCVLCGRCYCPLGIDIPGMIALARTICRSRGMCGVYPHALGEPGLENWEIGKLEK